jgi:hypothetical protein
MDDNEPVMLSTVDNPWSPFTNYDEWYAFDNAHGYNTPSLLARIANVSLDLSNDDFEFAVRQAMNEIVDQNVSGMHVLVTDPTTTTT